MQELNKKPIIKGLLTDSRSTISIIKSTNEEKFRNRFFGTKAMRLRDEVSGNLDYLIMGQIHLSRVFLLP